MDRELQEGTTSLRPPSIIFFLLHLLFLLLEELGALPSGAPSGIPAIVVERETLSVVVVAFSVEQERLVSWG